MVSCTNAAICSVSSSVAWMYSNAVHPKSESLLLLSRYNLILIILALPPIVNSNSEKPEARPNWNRASGIKSIYLLSSAMARTMSRIWSIFFSMSLASVTWQAARSKLWPG